MQYEKMSITQIEQAVRTALTTSKSSIIEATKLLRYLQQTNRYKENARYAKEPFKLYLDDQFGVRIGTFMDWVKALPYEKETAQFGVGLVSKTLRLCGAKGAKKAFTEISALEDVKKKSIPREKIDKVISKYVDPKRKAATEKVHNDWKAQYLAELKAHEETKRQLKGAQYIISEQDEQIRKLKITAETVLMIKKAIGELVEA